MFFPPWSSCDCEDWLRLLSSPFSTSQWKRNQNMFSSGYNQVHEQSVKDTSVSHFIFVPHDSWTWCVLTCIGRYRRCHVVVFYTSDIGVTSARPRKRYPSSVVLPEICFSLFRVFSGFSSPALRFWGQKVSKNCTCQIVTCDVWSFNQNVTKCFEFECLDKVDLCFCSSGPWSQHSVGRKQDHLHVRGDLPWAWAHLDHQSSVTPEPTRPTHSPTNRAAALLHQQLSDCFRRFYWQLQLRRQRRKQQQEGHHL